LGLDNWEDVIGQLDGIAPDPAPDPAPSPSKEPPAQAAPKQAERAAASTDTGAAAGAEKTSDPSEATDTADSAARTTYPKWWKGTEEEWQTARAESNRAANRERDRAEKAERAHQELIERLAFIESQISVRDQSYYEAVRPTHLPDDQADQIARTLVNADRQRGNDAYLNAKQQRDAEAARAQLAADAAAQNARTAEAQDEAVRLQLFADNLVTVTEYAADHGVAGLKLGDLMRGEFVKPENAYLLEISQTASPTASEAATKELYQRAIGAVRAMVDTAAAAKAAVTRDPNDPTAAGRRTVLGTASGQGGEAEEWTPEAADRDLSEHYKEQDRKAGGHYRAANRSGTNAP
jgi:hypothetical protein